VEVSTEPKLEVVEPDPAAAGARGEAAGSLLGRVVRFAGRHPLLVVLIGASAVAIVQGWWLWNHRLLGALDPDESGYIATSFRYHRVLASDLGALPRAVGGTGNGPLVPMLSTPLIVLGPYDPRSVLMMQPILMVVTAVAGAGIALRLAGPGAAMVSGLVFVTLPTVVFATQTYWLGLGAAAAMTLAVWALLASDRLTNRWTFAFGACVGAMLLSRTMTAGYVPAMVLAAAVVAGRSRASWIGACKAGGVAILVAGPWWFVARDAIFGYLFSYGYGERAGLFGEGGPLERFQKRVDAVLLGVGPLEGLAILVVLASVVVLVRRGEGWPPATRSAAAVGVAVVAGLIALASTTNNGVWFELPIVALVVPLAVSIGAAAPVLLRAVVLVPVAAVGVLQLASALWVIPPEAEGVPAIDPRHRVSQYEYGFEQYDPRFGPFRRDELAEAADDWHQLSTEVEETLRLLITDGQKAYTMSGNFQMFNSNTVGLAGELRSWTPWLWIPDTVGDADARRRYLSPLAYDEDGALKRNEDGTPIERVLVIARHDQHLFTPDAQVDDLYREALDAGWRVISTHPIPVGGSVEILRHPEWRERYAE
jgi:hypothetical protein